MRTALSLVDKRVMLHPLSCSSLPSMYCIWMRLNLASSVSYPVFLVGIMLNRCDGTFACHCLLSWFISDLNPIPPPRGQVQRTMWQSSRSRWLQRVHRAAVFLCHVSSEGEAISTTVPSSCLSLSLSQFRLSFSASHRPCLPLTLDCLAGGR